MNMYHLLVLRCVYAILNLEKELITNAVVALIFGSIFFSLNGQRADREMET